MGGSLQDEVEGCTSLQYGEEVLAIMKGGYLQLMYDLKSN